MIGFNHIFKNDYDRRIKMGGEYVFCYSEKKMKALYPEKNFSLVGEASNKMPKSKGKEAEKEPENKIGTLSFSGKNVDVFKEGKHNSFLYKTAGYVCVGDNKFVTVHVSRVPFFALLFGLVLLTVATVVITIGLLNNPKPPIVIDPDNPMPDIDPDIEPIEGDTGEAATAEKGGGSVSMIFTKGVSLSLSSDKATIFYQNPSSSNHSVVLELYIVSEEQEYFIGKTGLIPAGSAIYELDVSERDVNIRAGTYTGLYRTAYYEPTTGERASVGSDITGVSVVVSE